MCSVMTPPTSGPNASAIAETPAQMPIAVPRWQGGNVAVMIDSVAGFVNAAPTPCATRAPIRSVACRGETAEERRDREDDEANDEDPPPAEHVGELAAAQQEHAERQRVAVHDPLELGDRDAEVLADGRQGHVHDRVVEHDHEEAERNGEQRPPLAKLGCEEPGAHET